MGQIQPIRIATHDHRVLEGFVSDHKGDDLLIYCHGTPFPAVPYALMEVEAERCGLKLVAWCRPGYAGSTPQPGRTVRSFASDARQVVAALGGQRVIAIGWSGGGPHALSLGACLSDSCKAIITVGSVAPFDADDLNWLEGMAPENVQEFTLVRDGGPEFDTFMSAGTNELLETTSENLVTSMAGLMSSVDEAALCEAGMASMLADSARLGGSAGPEGWKEDDAAFLSSWGFSVAEVSTPVSLWQGGQDLMVPPTHGEWLATYLPNVTAHLLSKEGHLSLVTRHFGAMLDEAMILGGM